MKKVRTIFFLLLSCFPTSQIYGETISFADEKVKDICVSKWDTDEDGELSMDEAAAVTDLGTAFRFKSEITSFEELQYFTGLTSIGPDAFYCCYALQSLVIPQGVTKIEKRAFYNCIRLQHITIPSNVTTLEDWAFDSCSQLKTLEIEDGLVSVGSFAFAYCYKLKRISLPPSVKSVSSKAFEYCSALEEIMVDEANTVYDSRDDSNAIIETQTNTLFLGCKNTVIPSTVTRIGDSAFSGCSQLSSIDIPESVTYIGSWAFSNCLTLNSISIPQHVTIIDYGAFWGCENLTQIDLNEGLTTIEGSAFRSCSLLQNITLPSTLTKLVEGAFMDCTKLKEVKVLFSKPMSIQESTFSHRRNAILYVPFGTRQTFKSAEYWKDFKTIEEWFLKGDVNHDGLVNIVDVTLVIDYILDKNPENFHYAEANVNGDEYINVVDVTKIIDIILGK